MATKTKKPKRPRDTNQLAARVVALAVGDEEEEIEELAEDKSEAGKKGGKARAEKLTAEERSEIARIAAATRWSGES